MKNKNEEFKAQTDQQNVKIKDLENSLKETHNQINELKKQKEE
jgi:phage shock protein A